MAKQMSTTVVHVSTWCPEYRFTTLKIGKKEHYVCHSPREPRTQVGFQAMRPIATSNILVCGTARNVCAKNDDFLQFYDEFYLGFHSLQYLICEGFSTFRTAEKLKVNKQTRKNMNWFTDSEIDLQEGFRTTRIALLGTN